MDAKQRRQLVINILNKAKEATSKEAEQIKANKNPTREFIEEHVRRYVLSKYLLAPDVKEDDIKALASLSLARTMKLDVKLIHELDTATPCDHATSESTKKVLLLYAVQKDLELPPNPEKLSNVTTVTELVDYIYEILGGEDVSSMES
ncbi:hypothetical protein [Eubacterium oxidoreducens]|uniref:Uncharacterized protein n=1 Tax=Eubacterium oxidoreducens TaxID=1732 RepID=A0A1G6C1W3_EUBOX|nr:hypothetical protein [Eubacterium oxidoreducens]SDB26836.1 hypothetical protein SAMN02910417_01991 [Eubacterium oxidoreducens]